IVPTAVPTPADQDSFLASPAPPPALYTLSLHDALPICARPAGRARRGRCRRAAGGRRGGGRARGRGGRARPRRCRAGVRGHRLRSEEHTSELQSREKLVCRLLLEKKKTDKTGREGCGWT